MTDKQGKKDVVETFEFNDLETFEFIDNESSIGQFAKEIKTNNIETKEKPKQRLQSKNILRTQKNIYRRAFSETKLLDLLGFEEFKEGTSIFFLTGGDIDALSFLKIILRHQKLKYCLFSTWCMAKEDIYQFKDFTETGMIKKLDAYVGEIFPTSYKLEYDLLKPIVEKSGGRLAVFRNHSKIFAGYGDKFYFGIQSSANINTNPRTENAVITIGKDIFDFYFDYFDGINSFV